MPQQRRFKGKRILILHYRVGKTDGVSLEINAWKEILEGGGARVALCSGPVNVGADYVIDNLEQQLNENIYHIGEDAFGGLKHFLNEDAFIRAVRKEQVLLEQELERVLTDFKPTQIIISNIFSVGEHLPAPEAILSVLDKHRTPTLLIHHDFYWENSHYDQPSCDFVADTLSLLLPPQRDYITHCTINSIAKEELKKRKGIDATVFYDTFNFNQPTWEIDSYNGDLLDKFGLRDGDLIVLQATRIVRRKNIELAIDLVAELQKDNQLARLARSKFYNGHGFDPQKNRIHLVLAGYAEKRDRYYLDLLEGYAADQEVNLILLANKIDALRKPGRNKTYSLWDIYPYADIITYPSEKEGFGNQFLEAVFARKPIVLFEYPVFQADIKPKGFEYISLGDHLSFDENSQLVGVSDAVTGQAADEAVDVLTNPAQYTSIVNKNFRIAKEYFSYENTSRLFEKLLTRDYIKSVRPVGTYYREFAKLRSRA